MPSTQTSGGTVQEYEAIEMQYQRDWKIIFDKYDHDGDGKIPLDEIRRLLTAANTELKNDFPSDVIDEILERADWDKNRYLDYVEFMEMIRGSELGVTHPRFHKLIHWAAVTVVPKNQRAATIHSYLNQYSCKPPPLFMILITIVEVAVFVYYCIDYKEFSYSKPVPVDSPLTYNPFRRIEVWRYLTYMLIHAGFIHIFFNLVLQLIIGIPLEMVHKWWRVGLLYLAGVVAGSLGSSITDPSTFLVGASGGVYALITAHLANVIINFKEMEFGWIRLLALILFMGSDVGVAVWERYVEDKRNQTSYSAHFAGALAGLLLGTITLRNLKVHPWETKLGIALLALYIGLMVGAILLNVFLTDHFPKQVV